MGKEKNYYELLSLTDSDKNLGEKEFLAKLKKAFKKCALKYHPDKQIGKSDDEKHEAEEMFKLVNEANDVLSDPNKKRMYDLYGKDGLNGSHNNRAYNFDDIFGSFSASHVKCGADSNVRISLTLKDIYYGIKKDIEYTCDVLCDDCGGKGFKDGGSLSTCTHCGGSGFISNIQQFGNQQIIQRSTCPHCHGDGVEVINKCEKCNGNGIVRGTRKTSITIPKGVFNGIKFRLNGYGGAPIRNDGEYGDLNILIIEIPDETYYRDGDNLIMDKKLSIIDCLLGTSITVNSIDDTKLKFDINRLTKNQQIYKIRGKGMPKINDNNNFGDLQVIIQYELPDNLTEEQIKLLEDFNTIEKSK